MIKNILLILPPHLKLKQLAKNASVVTSGHVIGVVLAIVSSYFFANFLSKEIYGSYQFVLTTGSLMAIFTLRGIEKRIIRSYVRDKEDTLLTSAYQIFIYALPVALAGIFFGVYFGIRGNTALFLSITLIALTFPFIKAFSLFAASHLAREQFFVGTLKNIIQISIPSISLIAAILLEASLLELVATYCISQMVTTGLLFIHTIHETSHQLKQMAIKINENEIHLSISQGLLDIGKLADRLITFSVLGSAALASYMISLLPVRESLRINQILRALVLPKYSKYNYEQVRSQVLKKTFFLFTTYTLLALIYMLLAPTLFSILFPQYSEAILYTQLLVALLPLSSSFLITEMLTVFDKTKLLYVLNTFQLVTSITLMLSLALYFGILGLIIGKIIATLLFFCLKIIVACYR